MQKADELSKKLGELQREFFDATHHCWAYRIFDIGDFRGHGSDAGEPSGTAGRPILNAIEGASLADVGVVVVRYYGGVKLGTGGLARAYRDSAQQVLSEAVRATRYLYRRYRVIFPFAAMSAVYRMIDPPAILLAGEEYGEQNVFELDVRLSRCEAFEKTLTERRLRFEVG